MKIYTYEGEVEFSLDTPPAPNDPNIATFTQRAFAPLAWAKAKSIAQPNALSEDFPVFHEEFWQRENYDHDCVRVNACDPKNEAAVQKYIAAVFKLKAQKGRKYSAYDELVAIHLGVVGLTISEDNLRDDPFYPETAIPKTGLATGAQQGKNGGHAGPAFLPWHRQYLKVYEAALREIDPEVVIPFWDWTDHKGTQTLFGENLLGQLVDNPNFPVDEDLHYYYQTSALITENGRLDRSFGRVGPNSAYTSELTTPEIIKILMANQNYGGLRSAGFYRLLEGGNRALGIRLHNYCHMWIGGSMMPMSSPNDPAFWMHHANVDRLWADWQLKMRRAANGRYDFAAHYYRPEPNVKTPGHDSDSLMWPWDDRTSTPAQYLPDQFLASGGESAEYARVFRATAFPQHYEHPNFAQKVPVKDVLDPTKIGPEYDDLDYSNPMPMT